MREASPWTLEILSIFHAEVNSGDPRKKKQVVGVLLLKAAMSSGLWNDSEYKGTTFSALIYHLHSHDI